MDNRNGTTVQKACREATLLRAACCPKFPAWVRLSNCLTPIILFKGAKSCINLKKIFQKFCPQLKCGLTRAKKCGYKKNTSSENADE